MKFIIDNIWLIATALLSGGALLWPSLNRGKHALSTLQATQLLNQGKTAVIDVRTPEEFAAAHLRAARNIPLQDLASRLGELDKERAVLVMCATGARSAKGVSQLRRAGFADVHSLDGGFAAWQAQGLPTTK